jgi:hypothetical protein
MFHHHGLRSVTRGLNIIAVGVRSLACGFSASWMVRFPIAQDPIELAVTSATLVLAWVVGMFSKIISRTADRAAENVLVQRQQR